VYSKVEPLGDVNSSRTAQQIEL